jgi:U3 small nucleolar RNA-associated protein 25
MAPKKGSFRDKKRKFNGRNARNQPKPKKGKFDFRTASYVKERDAKNEAIESRRRLLEKERMFIRLYEEDSSSEEEDPLKYWRDLKATLARDAKNSKSYKPIATGSKTTNVEAKEKKVDEKVDEKNKVSEMDGERSSDRNAEEEIMIDPEKDRDDSEDIETAQEDAGQDPFSLHLRYDMDDRLYQSVSAKPPVVERRKIFWPVFDSHLICSIPKPVEEKDKPIKIRKLLDDEEKQYTKCGKVPTLIENVDLDNVDKLHIKRQIQNNLKALYNNEKDNTEKNPVLFTPLQRGLFSVINNYQDLYYFGRTFSNADQIRFVYCLHAINHMLKTRTEIMHHDSKLAKSDPSSVGEVPDEYRDQGFVRPKILFIVPFKHSCLKIVETLISILIGKDKNGAVMNKLRFMENFGGDTLAVSKSKPKDYRLTFQGNIDEKFIIGIAITKKALKLYTKFYSSDIIIASPLGLKTVINAEGKPNKDYDFLSSIELLIMDQADIFLMQNYFLLINVLSYLHQQPKASHKDINYPRLRSWCLDYRNKYYRQTLIFSGMHLDEIRTIMDKESFNYAGRVDLVERPCPGSALLVILKVPQVFYKFESSSPAHGAEVRIEFFMKEILPRYKDPTMNHTLIYVPCYYDFLTLRCRFMEEELSFVEICEHTEDGKVARARDMFFHSDVHFLLYTERRHFYRRSMIKGVRHVIFYQPPTYPLFYSEMCNLLQRVYQNPRAGMDNNISVTVLYDKFDNLALARIVGHNKASKMLTSEDKIHTLRRRRAAA